jgi:hypothetical protein
MQKIQKLNNLPPSSFFFKSVSENQIINNTCPYINYNGEPKGRPSWFLNSIAIYLIFKLGIKISLL